MKTNHISDVVKILILATSILITCVIVAISFRATKIAASLGNHAILEMAQLNENLQNRSVAKYDGLEVSGSDVVNCIKKHLGDMDTVEAAPLFIIVNTTVGETIHKNRQYMKEIRDFTSSHYIKPTAIFEGKVIKNENQVILGIEFTQKDFPTGGGD